MIKVNILRNLSVVFLITLVFCFSNQPSSAQTPPNTITFDNQSGEFAVVKVVGPTNLAVDVPNLEQATVHVNAGNYYILGRYGIQPKDYKYTKGDPFEVTQTSTQYSAITITLHKVVAGNYHAKPVSGEEFEQASERKAPTSGLASPQIVEEPLKVNPPKTILEPLKLTSPQIITKTLRVKPPKKESEYYFPRRVGNTWTYTRTVKEKVLSYRIVNLESEDGSKYGIGMPLEYDKLPPISEETYRIVEKDKDDLWNVKVTGVKPRDGRYSNMPGELRPTITWRSTFYGVDEIIASNEWPGTSNEGIQMKNKSRDSRPLAFFRIGATINKETSKGKRGEWTLTSGKYEEPISVPAGTYSDCVRNVMTLHAKATKDPWYIHSTPQYEENATSGSGYMVESFFCKDVGMVKEIQYNRNGNVTYTLELTEWNEGS